MSNRTTVEIDHGKLGRFVMESNAIEGICREPTREEVEIHNELLAASALAPAPECPAITVKPDPWQALDTLKEQMQETTSTVRTPSVVPTSSLWQRVLAWFR